MVKSKPNKSKIKRTKKPTVKKNGYKIHSIVFLDDTSDRIKIINNPSIDFRIPRVGEYVTLFDGCASLVVTSIHHCYEDGEILIFTDWYDNFKSFEHKNRINNKKCIKGVVQWHKK